MNRNIINLAELAEELTITELAEMMARRALRVGSRNIKSELRDTFQDVLVMLDELPIKDAFGRENVIRNGNVEGLIELRELKTLPYKYLKFNFNAVRYLERLGFIKVKYLDAFTRESVTGTQKLEDFMAPFEEEDGYPFDDINDRVRELVIQMVKDARKVASNKLSSPRFTKRFYLDTNQVWGQIRNQDELDNAVKLLKDVDMDIMDCKSHIDFMEALPNFGGRREHNGEMTLREWLAK